MGPLRDVSVCALVNDDLRRDLHFRGFDDIPAEGDFQPSADVGARVYLEVVPPQAFELCAFQAEILKLPFNLRQKRKHKWARGIVEGGEKFEVRARKKPEL